MRFICTGSVGFIQFCSVFPRNSEVDILFVGYTIYIRKGEHHFNESGADCGRFFDSSAEWWKKVQIMFLRRGLGVRGSHYLNDGKNDFGFHVSIS